jgi:hypothetical protein
MAISRQTKIRSLTTASAALALALLAAVAPTTASPSEPVGPGEPAELGDHLGPAAQLGTAIAPLSRPWQTDTWRIPSPNDAGGYSARSAIWRTDDPRQRYVVSFVPNGEVLHVMDRRTDGHQARAEVAVASSIGVIDHDVLRSSYDSTFDLGTPDGTGDIAEGLSVYIRVCVGETGRCSPWAKGTA